MVVRKGGVIKLKPEAYEEYKVRNLTLRLLRQFAELLNSKIFS